MKTQNNSSLRIIAAGITLLLALTMLSVAASAGTVTFSFVTSCQYCDPTGHLLTASSVGQSTVESGVAIDTVSSGASSFGLTGGLLTFTSAPATSAFYDPCCTWNASYDVAGGNGTITDSSFGTDLTISRFLPGGTSAQYTKPYGYDWFESSYVGDINPAILTALGLDPRFTHGYGTVSDSAYGDFDLQEWDTTVNVTFTPSPEPGSLALFGSGMIGLAGLLRKRLLG